MNTEKAEELLAKYKNGTLTSEEKAILDAWYLKLTATGKPYISEKLLLQKRDKLWNRILQAAPAPARPLKRELYKWTAAAACLIIIGSIVFYAVKNTAETNLYKNSVATTDIGPGSDKAILTLADGQKISLADAGNGEIAKEAGTAITKTEDGQIIYDSSSDNNQFAYNLMSTPKGGQYALTLADGTKVILNAASSLRYPTTFKGDIRSVELIGEAYFEVAKDKAHPFIVRTAHQNVKVLGTHFNINAYPDGLNIKTTLLEGSVQVTQLTNKNQVILKPGQQSVLIDWLVKVENVDTDDAIAWKNGYFQFNGKTLETAMLEVSRWYDVDVEYKNNASRKQALAGTISKYENVSNILKTMELTGALHLRISGRKIIVE